METGTQDITNQIYMNISTGNNRVNVSTQIQELMGSDVNLTVGYYDGSWSATSPQVVVSGVNNTFTISGTSTNLTLNYTFIAGNDTTSFYSPIIEGDIKFEAWSSAVVDTCTCPGAGNSWEINMEDYCNLTTACTLTTGNLTFIGSFGYFNCSAQLNLTNDDAPPSGTTFYVWGEVIHLIIGIFISATIFKKKGDVVLIG